VAAIALAAVVTITLTACAGPIEQQTSKQTQARLRLSTTTSVNDSGLLPVLKDAFAAETGYVLEIIANGSGAAIKLGETGDADVLLVHAPAAEEAFVNAGFGIRRLPFMYNTLLIAGPADDPADIGSCARVEAALQAIAARRAPFVSRGDDSGTHLAEVKLWQSAGVEPTGDWYRSVGKSMAACLIMAGDMQAYVLTDRATWLATAAQTGLSGYLTEAEELKNVYSVIAVNPARHSHVNQAGAQAWIDFLFSARAEAIIESFGRQTYGEALFHYDGRP
jgi:tungstate transport system substrate-binding protein